MADAWERGAGARRRKEGSGMYKYGAGSESSGIRYLLFSPSSLSPLCFVQLATVQAVQAVQLNWAGSYRLVAFGTFWGGTIEKERGRRARSFIWGREQAEETGRKKKYQNDTE